MLQIIFYQERKMDREQPFWQTDSIILLRWIAFIPVGFILTASLQVIPSMAAGLLKAIIPDSTLLTVVGALIAIPVLILLGSAWCLGVLMTPHLSCGFIAPSRKVSAVLYGTLFCLFEGSFLISILAGGASWISLVYQFLFLGITVGGIVMLHREIALSRLTKWLLRRKTRTQAMSQA